MPISVAFGDRFEKFIKEQLKFGRQRDRMRWVRLLEDEERLRQARHEELKSVIQEGINLEQTEQHFV